MYMAHFEFRKPRAPQWAATFWWYTKTACTCPWRLLNVGGTVPFTNIEFHLHWETRAIYLWGVGEEPKHPGMWWLRLGLLALDWGFLEPVAVTAERKRKAAGYLDEYFEGSNDDEAEAGGAVVAA